MNEGWSWWNVAEDYELKKYLSKNGFFDHGSGTFTGVFCGLVHSQTPSVFYVLDWFLWKNKGIKNFVELGTGGGAQTLQYAVYARNRGGKVLSFHRGCDRKYMSSETYHLLEDLGQFQLHQFHR